MKATEKVYRTLNKTEDFVTLTLIAETTEDTTIIESLPLLNHYLATEFKALRAVQKHGNSYQFIATK
jgi:hypothetical protein